MVKIWHQKLGTYMGKWEYRSISRAPTQSKELLVAPKDKDSIYNKGGVIYRYRCEPPGCTIEYTGETGSNFSDRYKEHVRAPTPIFDHSQTTGHLIKLENFSIVDGESQSITRTIKEAMYMRVNDPPLNRAFASTSWDGVLQDMQLSVYSYPYTICTTNPLWAIPKQKGMQNSSLGYICPSQGCLPSPSLPHPTFLVPYFSCQILVPNW